MNPNPNIKYPIEGNQNVQFIKNTITKSNILVGEYSYYDAKDGENLKIEYYIIMNFLEIALLLESFVVLHLVNFIMNGANHRMDGFSAYPFNIFGNGWEKYTPSLSDLPYKGDTVIEMTFGLVWIQQLCLE